MRIGKRWSPKQAKLIGRIILSNFLELPLSKFEKYITKVEKLTIFKKLIANKNISINFVGKTIDIKSDNVIACIIKNKRGFSIRYSRKGFIKRYVSSNRINCNSSDQENYKIHLLLCKLRHITTRNEFTHCILNGIIECQRNYFRTGNNRDLKPLRQKDLSEWISSTYKLRISEGWISRIINGKFIITHRGKELPLKFFFYKMKEQKKRLVKEILDKERIFLKSKKIIKPHSDEKLRHKLKAIYSVSISKRSISVYRRELGIPSFWKRTYNYTYQSYEENFSALFPFTFFSIENNTVENHGVYELRLANKEIEYKNDKTGIFYIGSTKNLRKRLKEHLRNRKKNSSMRKIIKYNICLFRYIVFHKDLKKEEKRLYNLFKMTFGTSPKCNKVSP